jgi:hypothetical protein
MPSRHRLLPLVVAGLAASAVGEQPKKPLAGPLREGMEALEAQLDQAVDRVSLPHAARLLGRGETARGYRLPGYGIVFLLTPRALPDGEGQVYVFRNGGPTHRRLRVEARSSGSAAATRASEEEEKIEALERQVLIFQHETEAARRAAEEEMDRIVQRIRVAHPTKAHVEGSPAEGEPAPPGAPAAPVPPSSPSPATAPLPPPPPWKYWFEAGLPEEKRAPAAVVADVRAALIDALMAQGARLSGLGGEERVTVAVDFVIGGIFASQARPEKTLVVSARARDVQARARGAITPEELRRRVEVTEY